MASLYAVKGWFLMPRIGNESLRPTILKAARKILVKEGVAGLSMRKIASTIGYTATSIYYHFKNKDELIHALIEEGHQLLHEHLVAAQADLNDDADAVERFMCHMRAFILFGLDNPEYYEIMYMIQTPEYDALPRDSYQKLRQNADLGAKLYTDAVKAGQVRDQDPYTAVTAMACMLHGYISMNLLHRLDKRMDETRIMNDILACIMRGILIGN